MSTISRAIAERQAQIRKLQADIDALQRSIIITGGKPSKVAQPARRRKKMSAAARRALSRRMKAYWAAKRKAKQ